MECDPTRSFTGVQDDNILVLVPAVAADEEGNRLGRGRGYYDQFLNSESSPCEGGVRGGFTTLSVMPNFAVVENIPVEEHDQALDEVISIEA